MKKKIIIISGDPNSINSEIIVKSWVKLKTTLKNRIVFVSNINLLKKQFKKLKAKIKIKKIDNINVNLKDSSFKVIDIGLSFKDPFGVKENEASKFVSKCLSFAHLLALRQDVSGLINCPIDKKLLGKKNIGVTELLASKCKIKNNSEVMLIWNKKFAVTPVTTHINIKDVSKKISQKIIFEKVQTIDKWFRKIYQRKPIIGVLGLNPHNSENRIGSEEQKIIIPTIKRLKNKRINVSGPFVADTLFIKDFKRFDVVVGMYHDQVLVPFKTIFGFKAINITLGLKYLRVSPDHGTAKNLIKKNKSNPSSLLECISFLGKF